MYIYPKLLKGKFITRYKRFFTDVEINEEILTVHNPNTGSMKCIVEKKGRDVLISKSDNPKRKLAYTVEAFNVGGEWALTNTILMNRIVGTGIRDGEIPELGGDIHNIKSEYRYGDGRIDFMVDCDMGKCLIEVKNVTLFDDTHCMFPDAVTERGLKHLRLLMDAVDEGFIPCMFYICQIDRPYFRPAAHIDPKYAEALYDAVDKGLKVFVLHTVFDEEQGSVYLEKRGELTDLPQG